MEFFQNGLRFNHTSEEIVNTTEQLIKDWNLTINKISENQIQTYENTILPFEIMDSQLGTIINNLSFYSSVSDQKEIRDASIKSYELFDKFNIELDMREDLYLAIKKFVESNPDYATKEQERYVKHLLRDYKRNGLDKDKETREKIKIIQKEIADLERDCNKNMNEDVTKVVFSLEELQGIPQDIVNKFEDVQDQPGCKYVSLKYPDVLPTLRFAQLEKTRQKLDFVYQNKCADKNTQLLEELVSKRHELALLLGYNSIADYILEIRMAKSSIEVQKFEQSLIDKLIPAGRKELEKLIQLKSEHTQQEHSQLQSWDNSFYNNLMKEKYYQVNEEEIKQYFPMQHVIQQTLSIYEELLSVSFKEIKEVHRWHKEVQLFSVYDNQFQNQIGQFYLDLYPRDGKYGHAAVFPLVKRAIVSNSVVLPVCAMVCNFNKANSEEEDSLMSFDEVETFFHEFGHIMHNICSEATFAKFSGTSVERDFVELPSQMLENWCWDKTILKRLSKHHLNSQSLPDELIDRKLAIKNLNNALFTLRQIQLGVFDHILHTANDLTLLAHDQGNNDIASIRKEVKKYGFKVDTVDLLEKTKEKISLIKHHPNTNFAANFGHLMGGYQAQYYGYLWSQVYSCDLFEQFLQKGIMDKDLGMKYRKIILAPGGSKDSMDSIVQFLGRQPNDEAFLKQNGFI